MSCIKCKLMFDISRSAAFFQAKQFMLCLQDIERALETDKYPRKSLYKLHERRIKSAVALKCVSLGL